MLNRHVFSTRLSSRCLILPVIALFWLLLVTPAAAETAALAYGGAAASGALTGSTAAAPEDGESNSTAAEVEREAPDQYGLPLPSDDGHHCAGEEKTKILLRNQLGALQVNPMGAEYHARLGLCMPFISDPGILFDFTRFEFGASTYLSPAYFEGGAYMELIPLSFLQLRAEILGLVYYPFFSFPRTGYHAVEGYDAGFEGDDLPHENAETGVGGWNANFFAILRAKIPLGKVLRLVILSATSFEFYSIGDADYYYNVKREMVMQQDDWIVYNESLLLFEWTVAAGIDMRLGLYNQVRSVPRSGYLADRAGAMAMVAIDEAGPFKEIQPFLRGGLWLAHDFRQYTPVLLTGVLAVWDAAEL